MRDNPATTQVVIVAKTRMGSGACIGGLTFDGRSVRLIAADAETNDRFNLEYEVGDVWEVDYRPPSELIAPHVENIVVVDKRRRPPIDDPLPLIARHMPAREGGLEALYDGLTQATKAGALYIAERTGVPDYSTMFWRPDQPLARVDDAKRIRYRYPTPDGGRTLTFVGYQEPLEEIPVGSLLRVSLAHWWRPDEMPDGELRCYVQLSGWFEEGPVMPAPPLDFWAEEELEPLGLDTSAAFGELPELVPLGPADMSSAQTMLKRVFGFDAFRPLQADIIANVLDRRDALAVMPTGSGKSLCFQLPALLFPGLTVIVSPLIALMEDQVTQLRQIGVPAVFLNSTLAYHAYLDTMNQVREGRVKLLYAAPETLLRPEILLLLEEAQVDCLTIDEAHCISEWGHDFRPEYRQLVGVRRRLPAAVCLAVTATATDRVRRDITASLGIPEADEFIASFNRENLFLAVEAKVDGFNQATAFLEKHRDQAGIIYCATRRQVDEMADHLVRLGWPALPYHAGLDNGTRRENQRRFAHEDGLIMVATIAFGMGIDKSNVRFILHYDLPKNLESYYQQIGRAGRDGLPADCLLLYSYQDVNTINYFINQMDQDQARGATMRLEALLRFAETNVCRRRPLLNYFGEEYEVENCESCDNCLVDKRDLTDLTVPAQKFLSCVKRTGEMFGVNHIIDVLRGSRSKRVLGKGHDRLSTYGIGQEYSKKDWQYLARQFIQQGLAVQDMEYGGVSLTPEAYEVFRGRPVLGLLPEQPASATRVRTALDYDRELFSRLQAERRKLAEAAGVPPYIIFSDRSLAEMAVYFPQSLPSFSQIHGVGQAKLARYADHFLALIKEYTQAQGISEKRRPVASTPLARQPEARVTARTAEIVDRFNEGQSIAAIAQTDGIQPRTVLNQLRKYIQAGYTLQADKVLANSQLAPEMQQQALAAFAELGSEFLRPVFEALGESVDWEELHLLRLVVEIQQSAEDE